MVIHFSAQLPAALSDKHVTDGTEAIMRKTTEIILLALLISMPACLSDGTGGISGMGSKSPLSIDGQVIACQEDDDCVIVELGCCDACNGGWSATVNKKFEDDVIERNHDTCTGNEICTDMWCGYQFARCENGTCTSRTEDWQDCEIDEDCVVVELGCCDHCNGGRVIASHKDYADDIREMLGDQCEENTACTLMACANEIPKCDGGRCTHEPDPEWGIAVE